MWYEIIPSFLATAAGLAAAMGSVRIYSLIANRRMLPICQDHDWDRKIYHKDAEISGDMYKPKGLDNLPSLDEAK